MYAVTAPVVYGDPYAYVTIRPHRVSFRPSVSVTRIKEEVAEYFGLGIRTMLSKSRDRHISRPRQIAMFLAKKLTPKSYPAIGREFDRDHTTIVYAVQNIESLLLSDRRVANDIAALRERLAA